MKLSIIVLVVAFAGCSFLPQKFDSTEYNYFTELQRSAKHLELACGNKTNVQVALDKIFDVKEQLVFYTYSLRGADYQDFVKPSIHLIEGIDSNMSTTFCNETATNMQDAYGRIAKTLGRREQ